MRLFAKTVVAMGFGLLLASCGKDKAYEVSKPKITFGNGTGIYEAKVNNSIFITPVVTMAENPAYSWIVDNEVVSTEQTYQFVSGVLGEHYLTFRVDAANGSAQEEVRVDVLPLMPPRITLPVVDGFIHAVAGRELTIRPGVVNGDYATYQWFLTVDGEEQKVSTAKDYVFMQEQEGNYDIRLEVTNEDGEGSADAVVVVGPAPTIGIYFESNTLSVPQGRKLVVAPYVSDARDDAVFSWTVDGVPQAAVTGPMLAFTPQVQGEYTVTVTGTDAAGSDTKSVTVKCVAPEGTYKRAKSAASLKKSNTVFGFMPAPGQFVNEGYTATDMQQACDYAQGRLDGKNYVSLGGFGGYIVVGFDHSIEKRGEGKADFAILGNAFEGSSEAGVIWVMQDEDGDGKPNDTWYELKGSETGKAGTKRNYAVTYYKPTGAKQSVRWTDNQGNAGTVDWIGLHPHDYYYPAWVTETSYTLRGTCLGQNTSFDPSTGWYHNGSFDWGYADNKGSDHISNATHAKIGNAVHPDGTPADLQYIDFIKVQTGINGKASGLGEVSTEVGRFEDLGM